MSTYAEQLKDPRWQRRRLECFEAANWRCQHCNRFDRELHVHHVRYIKNRAPWEYPDVYLVVLCSEHHKAKHELDDQLFSALAINLKLVPTERLAPMAKWLMSRAMEETA